MRSGRLSERITIQQKSVTRDTVGAEVITWSTVATVWAAVEPLRGREFVAIRQTTTDITTRFLIRYRSGITAAMRILLGSQAYNIVEVINPRMRNVELELMAYAEQVAT